MTDKKLRKLITAEANRQLDRNDIETGEAILIAIGFHILKEVSKSLKTKHEKRKQRRKPLKDLEETTFEGVNWKLDGERNDSKPLTLKESVERIKNGEKAEDVVDEMKAAQSEAENEVFEATGFTFDKGSLDAMQKKKAEDTSRELKRYKEAVLQLKYWYGCNSFRLLDEDLDPKYKKELEEIIHSFK